MMIPPMLGIVTLLIKNLALVSAIGVEELFYRATVLGGETFHYFEFMTVTAAIYFCPSVPGSARSCNAKSDGCWRGCDDTNLRYGHTLRRTDDSLRASSEIRNGSFEAEFKGISLEVTRGEVLCLIGPSGSGVDPP